MDLVLNFFTGMDVHGKLIFSRKEVAVLYLKSWFVIDFLSAFPFSLFLLGASDGDAGEEEAKNLLGQMLKLFRLIRLFRILRMLRVMNRLEYALLIRSTTSSILKFLLVVFLTSHWFSCLFYGVAVMLHEEKRTWADSQGLFAADTAIFDRYVAAFYWSTMTM